MEEEEVYERLHAESRRNRYRINGCKYTWENNQEGVTFIKEWLDRVIINDLWMDKNPKANVIHLMKEESDHCPILLL